MSRWDEGGWLDGLSSDERVERAELLDWLVARGFKEDELRRSSDLGLLAYLPAERIVMDGAPVHSQRDLAEQSGTPLELLQRFRQCQGLTVPDPDEPRFSDAEAVLASLPAAFGQLGFDEDEMLALVRVLGRSLAQAAQAMRAAALETTIQPGRTERELAEDYERKVAEVMPATPVLVEALLRQHLREMVRTEVLDVAGRRAGRDGDAQEVAFAFADLVGFTRLGEAVEPAELGRIADRLGAAATEVSSGPVRVVKQLGDGVMLVSPDPSQLLQTCFALADRAATEDLPQLRIGVAQGPATARGGDWFGRPVNLASRLSSLARAGSTLTTDDVHGAATDAAAWSFAGERKVKGVSGPIKLWRARPPAAAS